MSDIPCLVCGSTPSDKCHIKTKGSGGSMEEYNILPFCREHHQMQHKLGWNKMAYRFPKVLDALENKGWTFVYEFGVWRLRR